MCSTYPNKDVALPIIKYNLWKYSNMFCEDIKDITIDSSFENSGLISISPFSS